MNRCFQSKHCQPPGRYTARTYPQGAVYSVHVFAYLFSQNLRGFLTKGERFQFTSVSTCIKMHGGVEGVGARKEQWFL